MALNKFNCWLIVAQENYNNSNLRTNLKDFDNALVPRIKLEFKIRPLLKKYSDSSTREWRFPAVYSLFVVNLVGFFVKFSETNFDMDAAEQNTGTNQVQDVVGERCQKLFQDFLEEWVELGCIAAKVGIFM